MVTEVVGGAPVAVAAEPEVAVAVAAERVAAAAKLEAAELDPGRVKERRPAGRPVSRVVQRDGKTT